MPVNNKTESQAELDKERAAVNLSLHKQMADSSWSKFTKSVTSHLLNVKTEMEDLHRLLASTDLAALTGQQKADFLLKLNSSTSNHSIPSSLYCTLRLTVHHSRVHTAGCF